MLSALMGISGAEAAEFSSGPILNDSPIFSPYEKRDPVNVYLKTMKRGGLDYRTTTPMGVTPVEDQAPCDNCWIFATMGALEGKIRYFWPGNPVEDFSEIYLRECGPRSANCGTFGNIWMSSSHLTTFGQAEETCAPWPGDSSDPGCIWSCTSRPYRLRSFKYCDDSTASIQNALINHGPVYCGVDTGAWSGFTSYDGSFVITGYPSSSSNHAVVIVGYDDNLLGSGSPGWIVKNSWGADWGDDGYFYISYDSMNIGVGAVALTEVEEPLEDQGLKLMCHDDHGCVQSFGQSGANTTWSAQHFYSGLSNVTIHRIEFFTIHDQMDYEIIIYDDRSGTDNASTFYNQLGSTITGYADKAGLYSIDVDPPIQVPAGDDYYIAMRSTVSSGGFALTLDSIGACSDESWLSMNNAAGSWMRFGHGSLGGFPYDACIRAVVQEGPPVPALAPIGISLLIFVFGLLIMRKNR